MAINGMRHDALAPFGGYKQSGVGREFGLLGLESFLEAKTLLTACDLKGMFGTPARLVSIAEMDRAIAGQGKTGSEGS